MKRAFLELLKQFPVEQRPWFRELEPQENGGMCEGLNVMTLDVDGNPIQVAQVEEESVADFVAALPEIHAALLDLQKKGVTLRTREFSTLQENMHLQVQTAYRQWAAFWLAHPVEASRIGWESLPPPTTSMVVLGCQGSYWYVSSLSRTGVVPGWFVDASPSERDTLLANLAIYATRKADTNPPLEIDTFVPPGKLPDWLAEWMTNAGSTTRFLVAHFLRDTHPCLLQLFPPYAPGDNGDVQRIVMLLNLAAAHGQDWRSRMGELAVYPVWAALAPVWDQVEALWREDREAIRLNPSHTVRACTAFLHTLVRPDTIKT